MKSGLYFLYTSLLTISLLSSGIFFILVVSEVLHGDNDVSEVDLSGLQNISQKVKEITEQDDRSNVHIEIEVSRPEDAITSSEQQSVLERDEMTFGEELSLNIVTTDGLPDIGQPPIVVSLGESVTFELKSNDELLFLNDSKEQNDTKTFSMTENSDTPEDKFNKEVEPMLVVKTKSLHGTKQMEDAFQVPLPLPTEERESREQIEDDNILVPSETPQEDIPSFSEWAQKQLAEEEKKDTVLNHSSQPSHSNTNFNSKNTKLRSKNYASPACGAKIVAVNPEAGHASSILSPNKDEYMLNSCNSRIWFIVELCEPVQAQNIEIANFELFSSTPQDIIVYFSDRFPTRDWASVGQFTAQDMRDVQSFDLYPHVFGKFIKVEILSHYGSEHYCPISLFKVYGTSEFEVLEKESDQHTAHIDDEDDEIIDIPGIQTEETEGSRNLFGSARDAVMSIVKKAALALVKTEVPNRNELNLQNDTTKDVTNQKCCSPSHIIVCDNCSEILYNEVYELISCSSDRLLNLMRQVFLQDTLKHTDICGQFGLDFKSSKTIEFSNERLTYISALFPKKYLAALCNILAIKEKKVVFNTSFVTDLNDITNGMVDEISNKYKKEISTEPDARLQPIPHNISTSQKQEEIMEINPKLSRQLEIPENIVPEIVIEKEEIENVIESLDENAEIRLNEDIYMTEPSDTSTDTEFKEQIKGDDKNNKADSTVEKLKDAGQSNEESIDQTPENDGLLSDFDQMAVDPTPSPNQNQAQNTFQKESVFLRLSNRVKTLERNMSLSGQYLEELSRRYKKQVEEMQKTFEKTLLQMTEERRRNNEREQKYLEQIAMLQEQMAQTVSVLTVLMQERESWFGVMTFFKFLLFQCIVISLILYYINKKPPDISDQIKAPVSKRAKKKQDKLRRKSVEGVSGHKTPSTKKRRPSEEALRIARKSTEEVNKDEEDGEWQVATKNRKRKPSVFTTNMESDKVNWGRQDSIGKLQENSIPLDEEEFYAPVTEPTEFVDTIVLTKELPKNNGSIFGNIKTKVKTRRLSSPAFLRTLSRQSTRNTPSPVAANDDLRLNGEVSSKAPSESPTGSLWSESTDTSQNGREGNRNVVGRKKKSLKNIFRKVF